MITPIMRNRHQREHVMRRTISLQTIEQIERKNRNDVLALLLMDGLAFLGMIAIVLVICVGAGLVTGAI